jgi:hypothetical protein
MSWNHRSKIAAVAIVIQSVAGTFTAPNTTTDLVGVSDLTNTDDMYSATDPTLSGAIWDVNRIYLGKTSTIGFTLPLRGPGGASPPAVGAWVPGRALRAAGFSEIRNGAAVTAALQAGSTTTALVLAAGESAVDDFWTGAPIQTANIGTVGTVKGTSAIVDYAGATKTAVIAETIIAPAAGVNYTIPPFLSYVLGTLTTAPPLLSISVWRDKVRYDYRDCVVASFMKNAPVANEQNTSFSSIEMSFKGVLVAKVDDVTPVIPAGILSVSPPANRGGKFALDKVKLGHANLRIGATADTGAASNANQDAGQDGYDILSGSRSIELDLNAMNVSDFDLEARINNQTIMPVQSVWGAGAGNRFLLTVPNMVLDPQQPGDRNGYVSLTGGAAPIDIDKSMALTVFW